MISRVFLVLVGLVVLYIGAYAGLSLNGSYAPSISGNARVAGGGPAVVDVIVWKPKFVRLRIFRNDRGEIAREANFLGWLFYPLELWDRRHWHRSKHPLLDLLQTPSSVIPTPGG